MPALIVLDGLDEVAGATDRQAVIDAISSAADRLGAICPSLQCVVTSRPAATASAPRFGKDWSYITLTSIEESMVFEYTNRWCEARRIRASEVEDIKRVLNLKLPSPHIRELSKNAMQLTILLTLIYNRGQALPDQRTQLYDSYIDVFFNREADKDATVREYRQLLLALHGYLAWRIHGNTENRRTSGRVTEGALKGMIHEYLASRQFSPTIVEELFQGAVQRILALVSRVEGTFEFEVQPLREYFAARHLYDSSPYSPPGRPAKGTKPEILRTIAGNPFWLNVTRFYAGCYSMGELSGLTEQIDEMLTSEVTG
jgi:hypothetical protein